MGSLDTINSLDPEYGPAMAAVVAGEAELLYESFLPGGQKEIIVGPLGGRPLGGPLGGVRRNPEVKISSRKFKITLKEYHSWRSSWWREVIQNSVDAGAANVYLSCSKTTDETGKLAYLVSCTDDGSGMDDGILFGKLLTIGETGKEGQEATVGGFGVAKELILFPWLKWTIHTRNRLVVGSGLQYEVFDAEFLQGTKVEVLMPDENTTRAYYASSVLGKSLFPEVTFHVKDVDENYFRIVKADLVGQRLVSSTPGDFARVYFTPTKHTTSTIIIRVAGPRGSLFMFDKWVGTDLPGIFLAEIDGSKSTIFLNSNRDGFSAEGTDLERVITNIAVQAAKDTQSFARRFQNLFKKVYAGEDELVYRARLEQAAAVEVVSDLFSNQAPATEVKAKLDEIVERIRQKDTEEALTRGREGLSQNNYRSEAPPGSLVEEIIEGVLRGRNTGQDTLETMAKQLVWRPPFTLINEIPDYIPPASFFPETMEKRAVRLLKVWGEMCRQVMIALNCPKPYGVEFIFSTKTGAAYMPYDQEAYTGDRAQVDGFLVLNPIKTSRRGSDKSKMLDPRKDFNWLWAAAVHECTHMVDGIDAHDESFSSAYTSNVGKTLPWIKRSKKIMNTIGLGEGLSSKEAARHTKALQAELERQKREAFRQRVAEGGHVPEHPFKPSRGRSPSDPEAKLCSTCKRMKREHAG